MVYDTDVVYDSDLNLTYLNRMSSSCQVAQMKSSIVPDFVGDILNMTYLE